MKFLGQKAQKSTVKRRCYTYSLVGNVQSQNRGRMQPKSAEMRCLFRSEVLQDIVESAECVNSFGVNRSGASLKKRASSCC